MRIIAIIRIALRALRRNKLRTFLTMLGMIIGVAAVITMVSIGNGAKAQVEAQIASLGQNVLSVYPGSATSGGARGGWGSASTLTPEEAVARGHGDRVVTRSIPPANTPAKPAIILSEADREWLANVGKEPIRISPVHDPKLNVPRYLMEEPAVALGEEIAAARTAGTALSGVRGVAGATTGFVVGAVVVTRTAVVAEAS